MEVWGLSQQLIDVSLYHHHIDQWEQITEDSLPLLSVVTLANQLVNHLGVNIGSQATELNLAEPCLDFLGLEADAVEEFIPKVVQQYEDDKALYFD